MLSFAKIHIGGLSMNLKSLFKVLALGACVAPLFAEDVEIDIPTRIDIQGKKVMWNHLDDELGNNLEEWWGRAVFSVTANSPSFNGKMTIMAYPPDFGWEPVTGYTPDRDTVIFRLRNGVLRAEDTIIKGGDPIRAQFDKFTLYEAWAEFKGSVLNTKLGRYPSNDRAGAFFGNYADEPVGGKFIPTGIIVNALEVNRTLFTNVFFRAAFESGDENLNKGNLRAQVKFSKLSSLELVNISLGYRNNMFDFIHNPDTTAHHNATAMVEIPWGKWRAWGELAFIDMHGSGKIGGIPITGGIEIPGGRALDKIILEAEWYSKREADASGRKKEVLGSLFVQKSLSDRFKISFGVFNNDQSSDMAMAARLTSTLN